MPDKSRITFCISVFNENINYLNLAVESIINHAYYGKISPIIVYNEHEPGKTELFKQWFLEKGHKFQNLMFTTGHDEKDEKKYQARYYSGIGGGMNFCAEKVQTEYIMFFHADMVGATNFDLECLKIFEKYPNDKLWVNPYRFQPNCFNEGDRPGTCFFPYEEFGHTWDTFKEKEFINSANNFSEQCPDVEFTKGEGVSGLIRKDDWNDIGGNDPCFCPAYWEDADIFLRCQLAEFKFVVTSNSVVFHFGSRSANSNFPDDNLIKPGQKAIRSQRSIDNENRSQKEFIKKWGFLPEQNEHGFVKFPSYLNPSDYKDKIKLKI